MQRENRTAGQQDAAALAEIDSLVNVNPWSKAQFERACESVDAAQLAVWVLAQGGRIDGFIVYSQVLEEATLQSIAVQPDHQGKGLGRELLQLALGNMKQAGAEICLLEVRQSNALAQALYLNHGFQLDGVRKNYYPSLDGREDALLMSLKL
ncbi:MAG: ribosomal-protein-alanine N-acetyltransferase [Halioglobus sp.]|jgi:ribosomal-protein-alanine N-acetyltransferase